MSRLGKRVLGLAAALCAVAAISGPAAAFEQSHNCVVRNLPLDALDFKDDDIGLIVDLVFERCGKTPTTELINGPYRRTTNAPNPDPAILDTDPATAGDQSLESEGNARHDMVVFDQDFNNLSGNCGGGKIAKVTSSGISDQIGVTFVPAIDLKACAFTTNTSAITITDMTGTQNNGSPAADGFPEGQLVDAGPEIGGFDCAVLIKKGSPKLADIVCDMNMWYDDGAGHIKYGLRDYNFGKPLNRLILMWMMGPNPTASMDVTDSFCSAVLANGFFPARDFGGDLSLTGDPSSYADTVTVNGVTGPPLREETSISASTDYLRVYGEGVPPFNLVSCFGTVAYCDVTEPTPGPGEISGNACNRNVGGAAPPEFRFNQTLPGNDGSTSTQGGGESYFNLTNPFAF